MFQVRQRAPQQRQNRAMVELLASADHLPLCTKTTERWCTMPSNFQYHCEQILNFELQQDDVFVVTFPKSGTTWIQEAAWLLLNNLDYETARRQDLTSRSVFMDLSAIYNELSRNTIEMAAQLKAPRLIKSHLPAQLLPRQIWARKTKLIYCARNLKDVVVSYYHFHRGLGTWQGSIDDFVADFMANEISYTPYWASVLDFWQMRNESHVFFTTYEQLQSDLPAVLRSLCTFLQRPTLTDEELATLVQHLSFNNMKNNQCTNPTSIIKSRPLALPEFEFMRRGIVGAYKDELSMKNQQLLENWTQQCLQGCQVSSTDIFGAI